MVPLVPLTPQAKSDGVLKNGASSRDPALRSSCKCSHISQYAALSKLPSDLADGPMLAVQHPVKNLEHGPADIYQVRRYIATRHARNARLQKKK
jgi:hypothetical protein